MKSAKDFNLQVLTHEVWWRDQIMSPKEKIIQCIDENSKSNYAQYEKTLKRLKLINIDWDD